ncbi:hypothetical protein BDZ89DRAFT_966425 [Hymenopellis radicata]|nr:hypothetical protein BDZ89DRAFT_966425 [Hymenopellis radicata]
MDSIDTFIDELLPLLDAQSPASPTRLQNHVMQNLDHCLPFREHAPSRARLHPGLKSGGVHSGDILSVIRSLLIFRGITFDTRRASNSDGWYSHQSQWEYYRGPYSEDNENEFVNARAYGPTDGRSTKNFSTFWDAAFGIQEFLFDDKMKVLHNRGFSETIKFLLARKDLPSFGRLSSFLLVEDLVYAGLVQSPSLEEFAREVGNLKKGAGRALQRMVPGHPSLSQSDIAQAFISVFEYLDNRLSQETKQLIGFDMFFVEHALCKLIRTIRVHGLF